LEENHPLGEKKQENLKIELIQYKDEGIRKIYKEISYRQILDWHDYEIYRDLYRYEEIYREQQRYD
jgi:hypothetical protein